MRKSFGSRKGLSATEHRQVQRLVCRNVLTDRTQREAKEGIEKREKAVIGGLGGLSALIKRSERAGVRKSFA